MGEAKAMRGAQLIEVRAALPFEVRNGNDGNDDFSVSGHAAVFNEVANIAGIYEEVIAPGAFDGRMGDDAAFLINHEGLPLARVASGTLQMSVDARGLFVAADLAADDPDVLRIVPKMRRKDLVDMSFAFSVAEDVWDHTPEIPRRTITRFSHLYDVSIVTNGAYQGTDIALRSLEAARADLQQNSQAAVLRHMQMALALSSAGK